MNLTSNNQTSLAVLLLAHGTPGRIADIPEYMRNVTGGRPIPDEVLKEVSHRYAAIGQSPLTQITLEQAEALRRRIPHPVYVGMRNWHPYIAETLQRMLEDGVREMIAICLAPQNSRTSVGLYKRALYAAAEQRMTINFIESWHDHSQLIAAFAEKLLASLRQNRWQSKVIFTAHSVPQRTIDAGDPYAQQAQETAALVAKAAGLMDKDYVFAFQSQGMFGGPWLGPTVEETLTRLQSHGVREVLMQPIGFVCDHVEVLYDIDIGFRQFCSKLGMNLRRTESLNKSDLFIDALADLASRGLASLQREPAAVPGPAAH